MRLSLILIAFCSLTVACASFNAEDTEMAIPEVSATANGEQPAAPEDFSNSTASVSPDAEAPVNTANTELSLDESGASHSESSQASVPTSLPDKPQVPELIPVPANNGVPVASWDQHTSAAKMTSYEDKPAVKKSKKIVKNKKSAKIAKKDKKSKKSLAKHSKKSKKDLAKKSKNSKKQMAKNKASKKKMASHKAKSKKLGKMAKSDSRSSYR